MRVRRLKPYVCVDCDYAEHFRFQDTKDLDAAAGAWLRCLAYSRAQEQDGLIKASWLQRTFATTQERVEDLVRVGLLRPREDGDYELHAYAPRNQTRTMLEEERAVARERMATARNAKASRKRRRSGEQAPNKRVSSANKHRTTNDVRLSDTQTNPATESFSTTASASNVRSRTRLHDDDGALALPFIDSSDSLDADERGKDSEVLEGRSISLTEQEANTRRTSALVPTSTSTSIKYTSTSSSLSSGVCVVDDPDPQGGYGIHKGGPGGAAAAHARTPLPASERAVSGPFWLQAFTDGVADHTRRPCTAGRMYLGTLERLVAHHAPKRDAASACAWLREEARAFAAQWDGKHPAKGISPDGLERWLNDGRQGPPEFGRPRIVQPAAEDWHEDDWSDLGAEVVR